MSGVHLLLFEEAELVPYKREWQNMPEYEHADLSPKYQVIVNFSCAQDVADFASLIGASITPAASGKQLQSVWYPDQEIGRMVNKRYVQGSPQ